MSVLLLSDLHLPPAPSPLRETFLRFLQGPARQAHAVYLLGDLFEYWIGDDAGLDAYPAEVRALRALAERGVKLYALHGNRDFLLGKRFCQAAGLTLLPDPWVGMLEGTPTLLSHGDLYCTDDVSYQRWRRISRQPLVQWLYLRLPRARRERIAGGIRNDSTASQQTKPPEIIDVHPAAIEAAFRRHTVNRIIHGHTHRPAVHATSGQERIVLADWRAHHCEYLELNPRGYTRHLLDQGSDQDQDQGLTRACSPDPDRGANRYQINAAADAGSNNAGHEH